MTSDRKFPRVVFPVLVLFLASCSTGDRGKSEKDDNQALGGTGDSVAVAAFQIEVKLNDRAEKKLKEDHETIVVEAFFSGLPTDTTREEYQQEGSIPMGSYKIELHEPGVARFDAAKISRIDFEALSSKDFEVLINIYSGRRTSDLNLLNCDILQEPISKLQGKKRVLKGKLIE